MPRETPWEDEYTLLCERCGYVVEGLDPSTLCPECGKPIEESLPERRELPAWSSHNLIPQIIRIHLGTIRAPRRTFDTTQPDSGNAESISSITNNLCGLIIAISTAAVYGIHVIRIGRIGPGVEKMHWSMTILTTLLMSVVLGVITIMIVSFLTSIETKGLQFFGKRHGYRATKAVAKTATAYASIGWVIAATGIGLGSIIQTGFTLAGNTVSGVGFFAGFLIFETLAYLGLRRLKYANRVRPRTPGPASPRADAP